MAYLPVNNQSVSGTVGASIIGQVPVTQVSSVATVIIGGSIAASFTPPANQSVSGTVGASIIGEVPVRIAGNSSVINVQQGSVATVIIGGSIAASFTPPANQSVSGTVGASVLGHAPVVIVGGSILTSSTPNQSVSGQVNIGNFPTTQNVSGSVVAFQGTSPFIITGSVQGNFGGGNSSVQVLNFPANQSVSGTTGASVIGHAPVVIVGGSILTSSTPNQSVSGTVQADVRGSVATVIIGGSIAANFTPPANQSVSGEVSISNFPTTQNISGSVAAFLLSTNASVITVGQAVPNQSVSGTVGASIIGQPVFQIGNGASVATIRDLAGNDALNVAIVDANGNQITTFGTSNQSVSGTVGASIIGSVPVTQSGVNSTSVISTTPSSMLVGASIFGQLPAGTAVLGSVAVLQGTDPWTVKSSVAGGLFPISGSVAATITNTNINVSGSVVAFQGGTQITSISGVVNSSVQGTVTFQAPSVLTGHASVNGAASVQVLSAGGTGLYTYVTDFLISNTGAATTLVTFTDGDGSIMGKTIAPAGGGAVATSLSAPMKTLQTNKVVNIVAATATSVLHAWVGGYRAP